MASHIVYRIGSLGDTLVALPSIYALKKAFPEDEFILLCKQQPGKRKVLAGEIFEGMGLFEKTHSYLMDDRLGRLQKAWIGAGLWVKLRRMGAARLSYLAPSMRSAAQVGRDLKFFHSAGIAQVLGAKGFFEFPAKRQGLPLEPFPHEADLLLARLSLDGIETPPPGQGNMDLRLGESEQREVARWLSGKKTDGGRAWLGVAPFSNQPVNVWPAGRYVEVVKKLIEKFDIWPVLFGSAEESPRARALLEAWGRGYNAAGALGVRTSALAFSRCLLYLGADSGPIHLAAAVKTPCVGIYSAHGVPGRWSPYGSGHLVLRRHPDCEGCALVECVEKKMECILAIEIREVLEACESILEKGVLRISNNNPY
jgi:ADP-heptose:LPS heptosyltransferase